MDDLRETLGTVKEWSREPHPSLLLGAIVLIGLLAFYCHYHPDCAVCQFLEAYN
jgi:hypothetical protein